jgi:adenylate cyclase class 2
MATPQEVEIKFLVSDLKAVERKLRELGFQEKTPSTHEVNTLYDLPGQKLRRKGELLRLRDYGGNWRLTHKAKAKLGRHKSRGE